MPYKEDEIIGKIFNKLTAISRSNTEKMAGERKYECYCVCGKITFATAYELVKGKKTSCGCSKNPKKHNKKDLTGMRFGKLKVIEMKSRFNICKVICDCGNIYDVIYYNLIRGGMESCGCALKSKNPKLVSAKLVWRGDYNDGDITLEEFVKLSQLNCYYCNLPPSNLRNIAKQKSSNYDDISKNNTEYDFTYNGLDRIDNKQKHNKNNVVPCCRKCNFMKNSMTYDLFLSKIKDIYNHFILTNKLDNLKTNFACIKNYYINLPIKLSSQEIKLCKAPYRNYKRREGSLSFEDFIKISQSNCFYCNGDCLNNWHGLKYNGLDRVNTELGYDINNVVAACKYCNFIKGKLPIDDFASHILKIYNNLFVKTICL